MIISVIIPSYKPKEYIWKCLDSLYCQTIDKSLFEIILVLNGCNEPWRGKIEAWMASHSDLNINFVQTDTPGVSNARNIGLEQVKGKYITFIDDDDYVSSSYLEGLLSQTIMTDNTVILSNSISFFDDNDKYDESYYLRKTYYRLKSGSFPITLFHARHLFNGPYMKLFPRELLNGIYFDKRFQHGEDSLYMYQISKSINQILLAPEDCIYYRRFRAGSAITTKKSMKYVIKNQIKFVWAVVAIYIKNPLRYSLLFTLSRVLAGFKIVWLQFAK